MVTFSAMTSISPVASAGFSLPSGRRETVPMICSTYSLRRPWKTSSSRTTTWATPGGVAQVNEGDTTVVTTPADPAGQGYGLSNVLGAKGSEVMCAQHSTPF